MDRPYQDFTQRSLREQPIADPVLVNVDSKNILQHSVPLHYFKLLQGQILLPYPSPEARGREVAVPVLANINLKKSLLFDSLPLY